MSHIPATQTEKNLESAFAGESMAFMKYSYFAKLARAMGDEDTAAAFEETAKQEIQHAFGHLDLLYPADTLNPAKMLQIAIAGETYEYTEMYPSFKNTAIAEGKTDVIKELDEQINESKQHAAAFADTLQKAAKRFAALAKVEEHHANHYQHCLEAIQAKA